MGRTFDGRDISKTILNIGVAGEIELTDALPSLSVVTFQGKGRVTAVKHVFKDDGCVKEQVIIAVDPDSFEVLDIKKAAEQPDLPLAGAPKLPEVKRQEKTERPLLVSCETCGHGKADHEDGAAACRVPTCPCQEYTPFPGNQGTVSPEETDQVAESMNLQPADEEEQEPEIDDGIGGHCGNCEAPLPSYQADGSLCPTCEAEHVAPPEPEPAPKKRGRRNGRARA
ncbi:MAG: hypothetical protein ACE147_00805 [Candidatus Methylomirabilales bacterium]